MRNKKGGRTDGLLHHLQHVDCAMIRVEKVGDALRTVGTTAWRQPEVSISRAKGDKSTVAQSYTAAVGDDVQVAPDHGRIRHLRVGTLLQIESIYRADGVEREELQIHVTNGT